MGHLQVWVHDNAPELNVRLAGELDLGTAQQLTQAVDAYARTGQTITIDLREVSFIDSMGLAALVRARHRAFARGGSLRLVPPPATTRRVFELAHLDRVFTWVDAEAAG